MVFNFILSGLLSFLLISSGWADDNVDSALERISTQQTIWSGSDGHEYTLIETSGIGDNLDAKTVVLRYRASSGGIVEFKGKKHGKGQTFNIEFKPTHINQIDFKGELDIRQSMLKKGFHFLGMVRQYTNDKIMIDIVQPKIRFNRKTKQIKKVGSGPYKRITLSPAKGLYTIGKVSVNNQKLQERRKKEVVALKAAIELQEKALTVINTNFKTLKEKLHAVESEQDKLFKQAVTYEKVLDDITLSIENRIDKLRLKQVKTFQKLDGLKKLVDAFHATANDYYKKGEIAKQKQHLARREKAIQERDILQTTLNTMFKNDVALKKFGQQKQQQLQLLNTLYAKRETNQDSIFSYRDGLEEIKSALSRVQNNLERDIDTLVKFDVLPIIESLKGFNDGVLVYHAYVPMDNKKVVSIDKETVEADNTIKVLKVIMAQQKKDIQTLETLRKNTSGFLFQQRKHMQKISEDLYAEMIFNAETKYLIEVGLTSADAIKSFTSGDFKSLAWTMGEKLYDVANDKGDIPLFDETSTREHYKKLADELEIKVINPKDFTNNPEKAKRELNKTGKDIKRNTPKETSTAAGLGNASKDIGKKLGKTLTKDGIPVAWNVNRAGQLHTLEKQIDEAYDNYKLLKKSLPMSTLHQGAHLDIPEVSKAINSYKNQASKASKGISALTNKSAGTLEKLKNLQGKMGLAKGVGKLAHGFAGSRVLDAVKGKLYALMDEEQRRLWIAMFEQEMVFNATHMQMSAVFDAYWRAVDAIAENKAQINSLKLLKIQLEEAKARFGLSQAEKGFFVQKNTSFKLYKDNKHGNTITIKLNPSWGSDAVDVYIGKASAQDTSFLSHKVKAPEYEAKVEANSLIDILKAEKNIPIEIEQY